MPELIAHYVLSLLISSRMLSLRYAALLALLGLLPDIDALFRIHRWFTHSLIIASLTFTAAYAVFSTLKPRHLRTLITVYLLCLIHITSDLFTAPTPLLWPLTPTSYMLKVGVDGSISVGGVAINPNVALDVRPADFRQRPWVEGPIISELGVVSAIAVIATLITEYMLRRRA